MKIDRGDVDIKLALVNEALHLKGLYRYGVGYNTKGRGVYCLKHLQGVHWVEATDWMSLTNLWYFLDGMYTLLQWENREWENRV
jgi:hypothetical protein